MLWACWYLVVREHVSKFWSLLSRRNLRCVFDICMSVCVCLCVHACLCMLASVNVKCKVPLPQCMFVCVMVVLAHSWQCSFIMLLPKPVSYATKRTGVFSNDSSWCKLRSSSHAHTAEFLATCPFSVGPWVDRCGLYQGSSRHYWGEQESIAFLITVAYLFLTLVLLYLDASSESVGRFCNRA